MELNLYLLLALLIALLVIGYLLAKLHRVRGQLSLIKDALADIKNGNLNRRVLARESDLTKQICYDINEIAMSSQSRLIQQKQSEQAYKRLMTSLSHDVKTPLASLVGYLEAVESKMVTGADQEEYIRVAMEKAHHLKDFVTALFEWVKLDAGEQIFHFEVCDLNELSRNIMADWVPLLESHDLTYEIEIPETEYMTRVDPTAYTRILNNLLQNILTHSGARQVTLTVTETEQQAKIIVADNGKGISAADLPHIFERMYQCDHSRSAKGNVKLGQHLPSYFRKLCEITELFLKKLSLGKVMARFVFYTGLVVGYAGIAITALPHRKRGNKYERLLDRNKTTDKNLWRPGCCKKY